MDDKDMKEKWGKVKEEATELLRTMQNAIEVVARKLGVEVEI